MLKRINEKNKKFYHNLINNQVTADIEKYKFFGLVGDCQDKTKHQIEFVSQRDNIVVGYFAILVDIKNERVTNFSLVSFEKSRELFVDLFNFTNSLYEIYDNFEFRIVSDSPAVPIAEKLFKKFNIKKIGTIEKSKKILGEWHDENIYTLNKRQAP